MNRAGFLKRMAFAAVACGMLDLRVPTLGRRVRDDMPVLYTDGVNCDAEALEALIAGGTVWDAKRGEKRTSQFVSGESMYFHRQVRLERPAPGATITHCRLDWIGETDNSGLYFGPGTYWT